MGGRVAVAPAPAARMALIPAFLAVRAEHWAACPASGWMATAKMGTAKKATAWMVMMGMTEPDSPDRRTQILASEMQMPQPL